MSTAVIYVTGVHKRKEDLGIFAYATWYKNSKKPVEKSGQFEGVNKTEIQLSILIKSINDLKTAVEYDDVKVITDFSLIKNMIDGTVFEWEIKQWGHCNDKPINHWELWKELYELFVQYNINFVLSSPDDQKMIKLMKKTNSIRRKQPKKVKSVIPMPAQSLESEIADTEELRLQEEMTEEEVPKKEQTTIIQMPVQLLESESNTEEVLALIDPESETLESLSINEKKSASEETIAIEETSIKNEVLAITVAQSEIPSGIDDTVPTISMNNETLFDKRKSSILLDSDLVSEFQILCDQLGLPIEVGFTIFVKESLRKQSLSLDLRLGSS